MAKKISGAGGKPEWKPHNKSNFSNFEVLLARFARKDPRMVDSFYRLKRDPAAFAKYFDVDLDNLLKNAKKYNPLIRDNERMFKALEAALGGMESPLKEKFSLGKFLTDKAVKMPIYELFRGLEIPYEDFEKLSLSADEFEAMAKEARKDPDMDSKRKIVSFFNDHGLEYTCVSHRLKDEFPEFTEEVLARVPKDFNPDSKPKEAKVKIEELSRMIIDEGYVEVTVADLLKYLLHDNDNYYRKIGVTSLPMILKAIWPESEELIGRIHFEDACDISQAPSYNYDFNDEMGLFGDMDTDFHKQQGDWN